MFTPILLYILIFVGFVGVSWFTDRFFALLPKRKKKGYLAQYLAQYYDVNEQGRVEPFIAFIMWAGLFGFYCYFVTSLLH